MPQGKFSETEMLIIASLGTASYVFALIYYFLCFTRQKFALSSRSGAYGRRYLHLLVSPMFYLSRSCEHGWVAPYDLDKDSAPSQCRRYGLDDFNVRHCLPKPT